MSEIIITNATIINEGETFDGYIYIKGERIAAIGSGIPSDAILRDFSGQRLDAKGRMVTPGVIDDQVHFREPGLTEKGDIHSESASGVAGGVTSYMEMPNTKPPTTNNEQWEWKMRRASETSVANYAFYFGASNDNVKLLSKIDAKAVCGVKLFMGSSTGNMLVDDTNVLSAIFAESPTLVATHCEDEAIVRANIEKFKAQYGDNVTPDMHPLIRSTEACYRCSARAVELADKYGAELNVLHLSTAMELTLFDIKPLSQKKITNEVCVHHLWFSDSDYATKGNFIKWNPSIKSDDDRRALREGLVNGKVDIVATDHAPHTIAEKSQVYWNAPSGGPLLQHSLVAMLELSREGVLTPEQVIDKMCHAPAMRYKVVDRGFLRVGAYADIVIIDPQSPWRVDKSNILYKCGWSPFEGQEFTHRVETTIINGRVVYQNGVVDREFRGSALRFDR